MVHKIKRSKEEEALMAGYEEGLEKFGVDIKKGETEGDWYETQKKEYERQAKEFIEMSRKAQTALKTGKRILRKVKRWVKEKTGKEPKHRPIPVFLEKPKKPKKEIVYGEW